MKNPWMKFYPTDWRSDPALKMCSLAARGLWMEMLGIMHEAEPRGHLVIKSQIPNDQQLAAIVGAGVDEVSNLVNELENSGVFSRKRHGIIFSRRMVKDTERSRKLTENGSRGGNPSLCKETKKIDLLNQVDNTQKLEAKIQKLDKEKDTDVSKKNPEKKSGKKGDLISADWKPTKDGVNYAREKGYAEKKIIDLVDSFRDYWLQRADAKAKKLDWNAAWRSWVRNDIKFNGTPFDGTRTKDQLAG